MSAGDTVSFLLGVAGWVLIAVCLGNEQWKVSTLDGSVITTSTIYENLWKSCASDSTGVYNCRDFLSLFGLSAIVSLFGLQCIQFGTTDPVAKARMATAGGSLYILAALCALVPVSWYAFNITQQFYDPIYPGTKYELGPGLYIGWAGASLQLIGGIVLCLACRRTSGGTREYSYNYRAPRSMVGRVSKNYASEVDNSSNYGKNAYV